MTKNKIALLTTVFRKTGFVEIVDFFLIKLSEYGEPNGLVLKPYLNHLLKLSTFK